MPYTWTPRSTAPTSGTSPYDWNAGSLYQCTWYAYWRVQEGYGMSYPPVWHTGSGSSGSGAYTHAKYWLDRYRDPWVPHPINDGYTPKPGDIVVFTGNYGHCVVIENKNGNGSYIVTDYNLIGGAEEFGRKTNYNYGDTIQGYMSTGACIGCLEFPEGEPPEPPGPTPADPITISVVANIILKKGGNFNVKL